MLWPSNKLTMPLMGSSVFILGLVVASTIADETTSRLPTVPAVFNTITLRPNDNNTNNVVTSISTTDPNTHTSTNIINTTNNMNITSTNSTIMPPVTKQKGGTASQRPTTLSTTPKPIGPSKGTSATSTKMDKKTTPKPQTANKNDSTGIIILVVIVIVIIGFGVACLVARKRGRRYSVDFTYRPDEANIPLSTMEPDLPADTVPQNGLKTFESTETTTKEPQEPAEKPEVQEEQKTEADKSVNEPSAESAAPSAAPAPSPDSSEDKPKEDVVEQSPPSPVQPSVEEKTDDEGVNSNKTSVESLKEPNENNSNNAGCSQKSDLELGMTFWDIALDSPV
ncbi:uncharacterized protein [Trachinotus anak]|uniref:uncharacterized protein n=1 Tax=Trachinotus anak TaxID=443729 RepID=UPI0039F2617D